MCACARVIGRVKLQKKLIYNQCTQFRIVDQEHQTVGQETWLQCHIRCHTAVKIRFVPGANTMPRWKPSRSEISTALSITLPRWQKKQ